MELTYEGKVLADDYVTVALANLKYSGEAIRNITLELDRLMFDCEASQVQKKADKISRKVFREIYR